MREFLMVLSVMNREPKGSKFKGNIVLEFGGNTIDLLLAGKLKEPQR